MKASSICRTCQVILIFLCAFAARAKGPTDAEPVAWHQAGVGHTFDPNDPGKVYTWDDLSGHDNKLSIIFPSQSPMLKETPATRLNNHPVLGFGTGQGSGPSNTLFWLPNPLHAAKQATAFIVVNVADTCGGGEVWHMGATGGPNEWASSTNILSASTGRSAIPYIWENFGTADSNILINDQWMSEVQPGGFYARFGAWYVYCVTSSEESSGVELRTYLNGIQKGLHAGARPGWQTAPTIGDMGDGKSVMQVAEILLYDQLLTADQREQVTSYLMGKFGIGCPPPQFSENSGVKLEPFRLSVHCATSGATIRYTTNGLDPDMNSPQIANGDSIEVKADTIIKARAWLNDKMASEVSKGVYSFAPIPTKGLTAWSKAGFGLTFESGEHPDRVIAWNDASGNEHNQIKGSWAGAPVLKPAALNDHPVLGFGHGQGSSDADELYYIGTYHNGRYGFIGPPNNPLSYAKAGTGFIVARAFPNQHNPPYGGQLWDFGNNGVPNQWNPPEIWEDFGATSRVKLIEDQEFKFGEWYIYAVTIGGEIGNAVMRGYLNGKLKGEVPGLTVSFYEVAIGDNNPIAKNNTSVLNIAEVMLYDRVLGPEEMRQVTKYLSEKFAIPCAE